MEKVQFIKQQLSFDCYNMQKRAIVVYFYGYLLTL